MNTLKAQIITKTRLFKYMEISPPKTENFQIKNSDIFHISAQNIDCVTRKNRLNGAVLTSTTLFVLKAEAVLTSTHNLCFERKKKNNVPP